MLGLDENSIVRDHHIKIHAPLSPPPGFEAGFLADKNHDRREPAETGDNSADILSSDDFIPVGCVTVVADDEITNEPLTPTPTPTPAPPDATDNKKQYVFGFPDGDEPAAPETLPKTVIKRAAGKNIFPQTYFDVGDVAVGAGSNNPQETLIEREIRLQKEREEAVLRERELALMALHKIKSGAQIAPSSEQKSKLSNKTTDMTRASATVESIKNTRF